MPSTPTLTFVDDADGDSVTMTISGSDVGSTNQIFQMLFTDTAWALGAKEGGGDAERTGDGAVVVAVAPGFYLAYIVSTESGSTAASAPIRFRATSGLGILWVRLLDAVAAAINLASLTLADGFTPVTASVEYSPDWEKVNTPKIFVLPNTDQLTGQMSSTNETTMNVLVVIAHRSKTSAEQDNHFLLREDVSRLLVGKRLFGEEDFDPPDQANEAAISDRELLRQSNLFISPLSFDYTLRETRP